MSKVIPFAFSALAACGSGSPNQLDAGPADGPADDAPSSLDLWDGWTVQRSFVHEHPNGVASDPTVIRRSQDYLMLYTCLDPVLFRTRICAATSPDGLAWELENSGAEVVTTSSDSELENLEGAFVQSRAGELELFVSGYADVGDPIKGFPATLYRAASSDARFDLDLANAVLEPSDDGPDGDAVYSPSIVGSENELFMAYTGHCYTDCAAPGGAVIVGARSNDGTNWVRQSGVLLRSEPATDWMAETVAEVALTRGPDDIYYLFFTGFAVGGDEMSIGVARSSSIEGPYEVRAAPVITGDDLDFSVNKALAPTIIIEGDGARMWFMGIDDQGAYRIGTASVALSP